jgi:hypothetical protein
LKFVSAKQIHLLSIKLKNRDTGNGWYRVSRQSFPFHPAHHH